MLIAHDLGTTGNKASLHTNDGRILASVTVTYGVNFGAGGVAEQDPDDWWNAVVDATRQLTESSGVEATSVEGLVVSGQMMGAVLLDSSFVPVRPAIIWADTRSARQTSQLADSLGRDYAYTLLGHRLDPTYSVEKVMWVRDEEPQIFARARYFAQAKDYVVHRLTGRLATDRSDASGTNAYDQRAGQWSSEVLDAAGLDRQLFPEILESTDVAGSLTAAAADLLGLPRSVKVVMGGGDGPIAAAGSAIVAPSDGAYVSLGTSSWISFASETPVLDPAMRTFSFDHVVPGMYVPTATMQAGGASIAWISEVLASDPAHPDVRALIADSDGVQDDTDGLYFLPYLLGERSPWWNADARAAFVGLSRHHGRSHLTRAVLEGVAFNLFSCIQAFRDSGAALDGITAVGGAAASDSVLQLLSDVWGVPVRRRSVVGEANSLGAAVTGAVGLGVADFSAARALSEVVAEFVPTPDRHREYRRRHSEFVDAYQALEPWFSRGSS